MKGVGCRVKGVGCRVKGVVWAPEHGIGWAQERMCHRGLPEPRGGFVTAVRTRCV